MIVALQVQDPVDNQQGQFCKSLFSYDLRNTPDGLENRCSQATGTTAAEEVKIGLAGGQLPVIMASGGRGWSPSKTYLGNLR